MIVRRLTELGYDVLVGDKVCASDSRRGLPDKDVLDRNYIRAMEQGADKEFLEKVKDGYTGVIGILDNGDGHAAIAILNLYAIPRSSKGATRINAGTINAGTGRNVIADIAKLELEIRGETTEINQYMEEYAVKILEAAAIMHGTSVEIKKMGGAYSLVSDKSLMYMLLPIADCLILMKKF